MGLSPRCSLGRCSAWWLWGSGGYGGNRRNRVLVQIRRDKRGDLLDHLRMQRELDPGGLEQRGERLCVAQRQRRFVRLDCLRLIGERIAPDLEGAQQRQRIRSEER